MNCRADGSRGNCLYCVAVVPGVRPTLLLAIAIFAGGCASQAGTSSTKQPELTTSPAMSGLAAASPTRPLPSGGIPEDAAVSIAKKAAPLGADFVSVQAEPFSSVDPRVGEGLSIPPDRYVWVALFAATAAPCPPGGSTCESPRPGTVTVVLDYLTGERYVTAGYYPNPARTISPGSQASVTCSLRPHDCADALRAIEALPALDATGMPPSVIAIVDMSECQTVAGAPDGYSPCAAAMNPPPNPSATGAGEALATVTYRNGRGKAFLWLYWWILPSGRGPINAILQAHSP
jgi:hypothetical protein